MSITEGLGSASFVVLYRLVGDKLEAEVQKYATAKLATEAGMAPHADRAVSAIVVHPESQLADVSSALLVRLHNALLEEGDRPVTKFENRTIARNRFFARLEAKSRALPTIEALATTAERTEPTPEEAKEQPQQQNPGDRTTAPEEDDMAAKKKAKAKTAKRTKVRAEASGTKPDKKRAHPEADKVIKVLAEKNPKREGTAAFDRFALYRSGMKVTTFLEKGGTAADLSYDAKKKYIKLEKAD
jgi:hypothetical protein